MAQNFQKLLKNAVCLNKLPIRFKSQRRNLGKPPGVAKTLAQRLQGLYLLLLLKYIACSCVMIPTNQINIIYLKKWKVRTLPYITR